MLDYSRNTFDRDSLDFDSHVSDLENDIRSLLHSLFKATTSTEQSLSLWSEFSSIINWPSLQRDVNTKLNMLFKQV